MIELLFSGFISSYCNIYILNNGELFPDLSTSLKGSAIVECSKARNPRLIFNAPIQKTSYPINGLLISKAEIYDCLSAVIEETLETSSSIASTIAPGQFNKCPRLVHVYMYVDNNTNVLLPGEYHFQVKINLISN